MSVAEAALARDKPPAALLLRYRPLLVKTVLERHATLAVPRPAPNRAKKTAMVLVSAPQNAAIVKDLTKFAYMEHALTAMTTETFSTNKSITANGVCIKTV